MGLFSFGFGSKSGSSKGQESYSKSGQATETQQTDATKTSTAESTQSGQTTQQSQISQLDQDTQNALKQLISVIGDKYAAGGGSVLSAGTTAAAGNAQGLADLIKTRALGTTDTLNANTAAIVDEARRTGQKNIDTATTGLSRAAGSSLNSFVVQSKQEAQGNLESQLAALNAQLGNDAYKTGTQDLLSAFAAANQSAATGANLDITGGGAGVSEIATLAGILKGANTVGTTTGTQETQTSAQQQDVLTQLSEILKQFSESGTSETTGSSKESGFNFGFGI